MMIRKVAMLGCGLLLIVGGAGSAELQELTAESAEAFFDTAWTETISPDGKVPGAVITVVKDGEVLLVKGYGVRDIDTGEPVDPERTRVRIGSTSKLFSALTALSLVEDGLLDLDEDVNTYLDRVRVPETFESPITVRSLLSHTSGFDASVSGYMTYSNAGLEVPVDEYNRHLIRLRPLGLVRGYDNMGLGLLGHICGVVNGTTFSEAVRQRVLEPLGMHHTTMGIPDEVLPEVGACHTLNAAGEVVKCRPKLMREGFQAAGDIATTGADMGRFMIALLAGGELDGVRVLSPELFSEFMDPDQNRWHPALPGLGFIIYESQVNGRRSMGHNGGQDGFSTAMNLFPEAGVGIFASVFTYPGIPYQANLGFTLDMMKRGAALAKANGYARLAEAWSSFAETFLPPTGLVSRLARPAERTEPLSVLDGRFASARTNVYPVMDRMSGAFGHLRIEVNGDDVFIGGKGPYLEVAPYELAMEGEDVRYAFRVNRGAVVLNSSNGFAAMPFLKQPWHYRGDLTVLPLVLAIILALPGGVYALVRRKVPGARWLAALAFAAGACLLAGLLLEFQYFPVEYFRNGGSVLMVFWRLLIQLAWLAAIAGLVLAIRRRADIFGFGGAGAAFRSLFMAAIAVGFVAIAILVPYWGLLLNFTH